MRDEGPFPEHRAADGAPEVAVTPHGGRLPVTRLDLLRDAVVFRALDDGRVRFWNAGAEALYGWRADEAIGQPLDSLFKTVYPLPRAYQVVRQHGGEVELDSREGQGTTFSVWLPLSGTGRGCGQHRDR